MLIATPSASSTSAVPALEDIARLPCFRTGNPAPATVNAAIVEMFTVCAPSPPVPTTSTAMRSKLTSTALASMALTMPLTSCGVSPFTRRPITNPASWESVAVPDIISFIAQNAWSNERSCPETNVPKTCFQLASVMIEMLPYWEIEFRFLSKSKHALTTARGSIGCATTASARDHVANQRSSTRPTRTRTGGQL